MHMSFWFGTNIGDFLFEGFTIVTTPGFISTCFGLLAIAVLFEAVKIGLVWRRHNASLIKSSIQADVCQDEASTLLTTKKNGQCSSSYLSTLNQLILFLSREIMSYTLMLAIMTYNGYFTISIIIGGGLGFFIFSPILMELGLRNAQMKGPALFCRICSDNAMQKKDKDDDSLTEVAQGVCHVVNTTNGEDPKSKATVAVVEVHTSNESQIIA